MYTNCNILTCSVSLFALICFQLIYMIKLCKYVEAKYTLYYTQYINSTAY